MDREKKTHSPRRDAAGAAHAVLFLFLVLGGLLFFTSSVTTEPAFTGLGMCAFAAVGWIVLAIWGPDRD